MSAEAMTPPLQLPSMEDSQQAQRQALRRYRFRRGLIYAAAVTLSLWVLIPIWLIGVMAFSTPANVRAFPKDFVPSPVSTDTIEFFLNAEGILASAGNSLIVALITLALSTLIAVPGGYAIARFAFRGRDTIRLAILSVRAFPIVVLAVPMAVIFIRFGLYDRPVALALMHTALTLPTTILVISSVFMSVPYEFEEAAQVFGCTPLQAFRYVVLPLALPGIAAAALLTFVLSLNEVFAAIMLTLNNRTLPAQILYSLDKSGDPFKFAGAFVMLVPALIFTWFIRRYLFNLWGSINK
jgi:multiple sugar transport system permease protein